MKEDTKVMTDHNRIVKHRLAKKKDIEQLAKLHWDASITQPSSFMFKLGVCFLKKYYKFIIEENNSLILCAVDNNERILGFVSGSLDNSERIKTLHSKKIALLFSAIPQILRNPFLIKEIASRFYSGSADRNDGYIVHDGPHEDFWAWQTNDKPGNEAILLHLTWLKILKCLGIDHVRGEVDLDNKIILRIHKFLGAKIVKEYNTPDARRRVIFEYDLTTYEV